MNWLQILLQANIYMLLFYGFYRLLLYNETFFTLSRIYLIGSVLLAFLIPVWHSELVLGWLQSRFSPAEIQATYVILQPVTVVLSKPIKPAFTWSDFLVILYILGLLFFCIRLIINLLQLKKYFSNFSDKIENIANSQAFSFFQKVFVSEKLMHRETILRHEKVHVRQWHSADVLFLEIVAVICWFNPVAYFYKQAIKHLHEFIADEIAAQNECSKADYAQLLFSQQFGIQPHQLTNSFFNHSLLKRRIMMLSKPRSRRTAFLKYGLSVPLCALMLVFSSASSSSQTAQKRATVLPTKNKAIDENVLVSEPATSVVLKDSVYKTADINPEFKGGVEKMFEFIGKTIKYPKKAQIAKIQGKVFVGFVVRKDGTIGDIKIMKGLGYGCDEEAIRAISLMPKWKGAKLKGKPVNVYYTMPVVFQLK